MSEITMNIEAAAVMEPAAAVLLAAIDEEWRMARDGEWTLEAAFPHIRKAVFLTAALNILEGAAGRTSEHRVQCSVPNTGEWGAFVRSTLGYLI